MNPDSLNGGSLQGFPGMVRSSAMKTYTTKDKRFLVFGLWFMYLGVAMIVEMPRKQPVAFLLMSAPVLALVQIASTRTTHPNPADSPNSNTEKK